MTDLSENLAFLADLHRDMKPTGYDGFEGLVGSLLGGLCGTPFRLASSGSQQGQDGQNRDTDISVSFEAKRYSNKIGKDGVQSKVTEICAKAVGPDIWVLAATGPLDPTVENTIRRQFEKEGIAFLCLDWCPLPDLPRLAVLCADQASRLLAFAAIAEKPKPVRDRLEKALAAIRVHEGFEPAVADLRRQLSAGSVGLDMALRQNSQWLRDKLSDKHKAKAEFGQLLTPLAEAAVPIQPRETLIAAIADRAFQTASAKPYFVLGEEGHGKSVSIAQAYLTVEDPCLTLLLFTANLGTVQLEQDVEDFVIESIVRQTGDRPDQTTIRRWHRRFSVWRDMPEPSLPRMTIIIDGINQRPRLPWARWIERLLVFSREIGANVVISSRTLFANQAVFPKLYGSRDFVNIPAWSHAELEQILRAIDIEPKDIQPDVFDVLKNPRLLSVAVETLGDERIETLAELNPSRLLYEYIGRQSQESASAQSLQSHVASLAGYASLITERLQGEDPDDQSVFTADDKTKLRSELDAISAERLFVPVSGSPELFELRSDGLDLAMGMSLIGKLKKADRNGRDVFAEIDAVLEPIAALDRTSGILLGGCTVAVLDKDCPEIVRSALITAYLSLQNLDDSGYDVFQGLVRSDPHAALGSLTHSYRSGAGPANKDWLLHSLLHSLRSGRVLEAVTAHVHATLRQHTLDPRANVLARRSDNDWQEKVNRRDADIQKKLDGLTTAEQDFLDQRMTTVSETDTAAAALDCFYLITGRPLAEFAESLFAWRFGAAINASFRVPYDDFADLLTFNTFDWEQTRQRLMEVMKPYDVASASETMRWAIRGVLRATGSAVDEDRAVVLFNALNGGPFESRAWRAVDRLCDTDPCDPTSGYPTNIEETLEKLTALDFAEFRTNLSMTGDEHFLSDAVIGLARFKPDKAFPLLEGLAQNIVERDGRDLRFGLFYLRKVPELMPPALAEYAANKATDLLRTAQRGDDEFLHAQHLMLPAFVHLEGQKQLSLLDELEPSIPIMTTFEHVFHQAPTEDIEEALESALASGGRENLVNMMCLLRHQIQTRTYGSVSLLERLLAHENSVVRAFTLALLADGYCNPVLRDFCRSDWTAKAVKGDKEFTLEAWHGSRALIRGANQGLISYSNAAPRISHNLFGALTARKDPEGTGVVARLLDIALQTAVGVTGLPPMPKIGIEVLTGGETDPHHFDVREREDEPPSWREAMDRANDTAEDFDRRQQEIQAAFYDFRVALSRMDARILLEDIGRRTIGNIYEVTPDVVERWACGLLEKHQSDVAHFRNIALYVAEAISAERPALAVDLFRRSETLSHFTHFTSGLSKLSLQHSCLWGASDSEAMKAYRAERIRQAEDDAELFDITLAAQRAGRTAELFTFIEGEISSGHPARAARAVAVTGFLDESLKAGDILESVSECSGIVGRAYLKAVASYERNVWSRHWFRVLSEAPDRKTFWKNGVLLAKIVDGRIDLWRDEHAFQEATTRFAFGITDRVKDRIGKWKTARAKKLFGERLPNSIFISRRPSEPEAADPE